RASRSATAPRVSLTTGTEPTETWATDAGGAWVAPSFCQAARGATASPGELWLAGRLAFGAGARVPQAAASTRPRATRRPAPSPQYMPGDIVPQWRDRLLRASARVDRRHPPASTAAPTAPDRSPSSVGRNRGGRSGTWRCGPAA